MNNMMQCVMRNIFLLSILATMTATVSGTVNIIIDQKNVNVNDQFSLDIQLAPNGTTVAGAQTDLRFNPAVLQVINVTEGNFLNRNGPTFFMPTVINNTNGLIKNIAVAVLHPGGENASGTFVTIDFKAITAGNSELDIVNSMICDPNGNVLQSKIQNGSIFVTQSSLKTFNISGFVLNGNDNSGISNWSIILSNNSTFTNTTNTTVNGKYQFSGLYNGSYNISEVVMPGWKPVGPTTIKLIINGSDINNQNFTNKPPVPPASITGLKKISNGPVYINWTWTDPKSLYFSHVMIYINGVFKTNVSKGVLYYNATNLTKNTAYRIGTHTVDYYGGINNTWVNNTAKTSK